MELVEQSYKESTTLINVALGKKPKCDCCGICLFPSYPLIALQSYNANCGNSIGKREMAMR